MANPNVYTKTEWRQDKARARKLERFLKEETKKNGKRVADKKSMVALQWIFDLVEQARGDDALGVIRECLQFGFIHGYLAAKGHGAEELPELIRSGAWGKIRFSVPTGTRRGFNFKEWKSGLPQVEKEALKAYRRQWFS